MIYKFKITATVMIEAGSAEEALDKFMDECPYDVDGNTIECECVGEE